MKNKCKRSLRYVFNDQEIIVISKELADAQLNLCSVENDKKRVVDEFKSKTSFLEAIIGSLSNKVSSGYEIRDIECAVVLNSPKNGKKTIIREDTNEVVSVEDMSAQEMQEEMPLEIVKP